MQTWMNCLGTAALALSLTGHAAAFDKIVVFGDSLSDSGNAYNIVGAATPGAEFPPPPNNQRNSNGLVAVEYLAQTLGITLLPSTVSGGTNYAVSGALTGPRTALFPSPPIPGGVSVTTENYGAIVYGPLAQPLQVGTSLVSQVGQFISTAQPVDPQNTLFVVWGGANDFFFDPQASTVSNAVTNIVGSIGALAQVGARHFLVPGLPDLSLTPGILAQEAGAPGLGIGAGFQALSLGFNQALQGSLVSFEGSAGVQFSGLDITYFDVNASLQAVLANPLSLGLTNVTQGCNDVFFLETCANPDAYLFWDPVHPTDKVHAELGRQFAAAVPEPATWGLMFLGMLLVAGVAVRRGGCQTAAR
jgi:phospholipase/lecithinase/hemolysin